MELAPLGIHQDTYDAVFRHPIARNLQWHDVRAMLGALANVTENGGHVTFTRNGATLALYRPRGKDISDSKEVTQIRHFLERSGPPPKAPAAERAHSQGVIT